MTAAGTAHLSIDMLSAYLDRELSVREVTQVEEHLETCTECGVQLDSLGRVVGRLRSLERMAPPQLLEMDVQRRIALAAPEDNLLGKLDGRLGRLPVQPGILVTFALVFCFAAILFTFAQGLEDRHPRTIPIILSPAATSTSVASEDGGIASSRSRWEWTGEEWQLGTEAERSPGIAPDGSSEEFFRDEIEVDEAEVILGSPEWTSLVAEWPQLQVLQEGALEESMSGGETRILLPDRSSVRVVEARPPLRVD